MHRRNEQNRNTSQRTYGLCISDISWCFPLGGFIKERAGTTPRLANTIYYMSRASFALGLGK